MITLKWLMEPSRRTEDTPDRLVQTRNTLKKSQTPNRTKKLSKAPKANRASHSTPPSKKLSNPTGKQHSPFRRLLGKWWQDDSKDSIQFFGSGACRVGNDNACAFRFVGHNKIYISDEHKNIYLWIISRLNHKKLVVTKTSGAVVSYSRRY